jgi:hypothetical protein
VKEVYLRHFKRTREWGEAHNATLDELAPPFSREMSDQDFERRKAVGDAIGKVYKEAELEAGDPYRLAVKSAMEDLKRDDALDLAKAEYASAIEAAIEVASPRKPRGRKQDWTPKAKQPSAEELEPEEKPDLNLYLEFNDEGQLRGWTIDAPDYYPGHGGPLGVVSLHEDLTWEDIETGVEEGLEDVEFEESGS